MQTTSTFKKKSNQIKMVYCSGLLCEFKQTTDVIYIEKCVLLPNSNVFQNLSFEFLWVSDYRFY